MNNVIEMIEKSAEVYADRIAFSDQKSEITYKELTEAARSVAQYILDNDQQHKPVVVITRRDIESVILILGAIYSGNVYIPMDSSYTDKKIISVLDKADSNIVLCQKRDMRVFSDRSDIHCFSYEEAKECKADSDALRRIRERISASDLMCCFLTSGTTGEPKCVMKSHFSIMSMVKSFTEQFDFSGSDVFGCQTSLDFDSSNKSVFISLYLGAQVYIIPKEMFIFPGRLVPEFNSRRVSVLIWSVSALALLARIKIMKNEKFLYLRKVMFSGEAIACDTISYWKDNLVGTQFVNLYGPTEMTGNALFYEVGAVDENKPIPMGSPMPDTKVYLLDENRRLITQNNVKGELYIGGNCLAAGYYNDDEKTKETFIKDPFEPERSAIIYRTGDMGYINDDGEYVFSGRKDLQIKRNGYRIELSAIETAVMRSGLVSVCCCVFRKSKEEICLYYQSENECCDQLYSFMKRELSWYMMPNKIERIDHIPLNSHDKPDRKKLTEME